MIWNFKCPDPECGVPLEYDGNEVLKCTSPECSITEVTIAFKSTLPRSPFMKKKKDCVICGEPIKPDPNGWDGGHNAQPVAEGQCCGDCNDSVVTVRRLVDIGMKEDTAKIVAKDKFTSSLYVPEEYKE